MDNGSEERAIKVRENRLRRMAQRQGLTLHKSRTRDPWGLDYGMYWLFNPRSGGADKGRVPGDFITPSATLDDIEDWLQGGSETAE